MKTISWSDIPVKISVLLTSVGLFIIIRSKVLSPLVGWSMTWVKPWLARMSRNRVCCEGEQQEGFRLANECTSESGLFSSVALGL